ncbi:response regulator [Oceanobacter mangrovi]|uniref:response regulator n=1 Tax=Oceanobacter mangrovi TaxID=2862510 RepID=UPI001C8E495D|nr:response regulator transcription factor [Oceanobacter mangrovi]
MNHPHAILQVDDHTIFRNGLNKLLADSGRFAIQAEAANIEQACEQLQQHHNLELVILDVNLAGQNSLDHLVELRNIRPAIPVLVMSMYPATQFAPAAYRAGANAYLSKDASSEELLQALGHIIDGQNWHIHLPDGEQPQGYPHEILSERELAILKHIANGDALTDIGSKMFLSVKTVSTYRSRILEKLDMTNNAELIKYALQHGLVV